MLCGCILMYICMFYICTKEQVTSMYKYVMYCILIFPVRPLHPSQRTRWEWLVSWWHHFDITHAASLWCRLLRKWKPGHWKYHFCDTGVLLNPLTRGNKLSYSTRLLWNMAGTKENDRVLQRAHTLQNINWFPLKFDFKCVISCTFTHGGRDLTLRTHIGIWWVLGERWCRLRTTTPRMTENVTRIMVNMM